MCNHELRKRTCIYLIQLWQTLHHYLFSASLQLLLFTSLSSFFRQVGTMAGAFVREANWLQSLYSSFLLSKLDEIITSIRSILKTCILELNIVKGLLFCTVFFFGWDGFVLFWLYIYIYILNSYIILLKNNN